MEIKVIGSSTAWSERPCSSYCINNKILIDCGEGTTKVYNKLGIVLNDIKYIFITHTLSDHTLGLVQYLCQHVFYNSIEKYKTLTIFAPRSFTKFLHRLFKLVCDPKPVDLNKYINIIEITNFSQKIYIEDFTITPFKLKHGGLTDIGYVFDDNQCKVGFSGDTTYTKNLEKFVYDSDYLFLCCCSSLTTTAHIGLDRYKQLENKYPEKRFYAIHCVDAIYNNAKQYNIRLADSGDVIDTSCKY